MPITLDTSITYKDFFPSINVERAIACEPNRFANHFFRLQTHLQQQESFGELGDTLTNRLEAVEAGIQVLIAEEDEDDFVYAPSDLALNLFNEIVVPAYSLSVGNLVEPIIAPDGIGGIKFDWRKSFREEVRLYLSGTENRASYIYFRFGELDDVINNPTAEKLSRLLQKLVQ